MKSSPARILALKLVVTCVLLWFVFHKVDIAPLEMRLGTLQTGWAMAALAVLFAQLLLTGIRWYFVGQLVDAGVPLTLAIRLILVGQFFNQVLPSSVGGDGVRAWLLSLEGISIRRALVSVICDRAAALVLLTAIVACTLPIVIVSGETSIPWAWSMAITVEVFAAAGILFLFIWGDEFSEWLAIRLPAMRPFGVLVHDLRRVLFSCTKSWWVVGLTIIVQTMVVASAYCCALALGFEFGLIHLLILPLIMLVASIPVSFAGWGLREGAMVTGLGFASMPAADALAVSVSLGIAQLVIGLPGLVIAILSKYRRNKTDNEASI